MSEILSAVEALPAQADTTTLAQSYLLGFDTETTGVSPSRDAIVSASLVLRNPATGHEGDVVGEWVINPHRPISPGASAVNGFTNEFLEEHGSEPTEALEEVAAIIAAAQERSIPLLAYNAPFDVEMINADLTRWELPTIAERAQPTQLVAQTLQNAPLVVDPLVIDRAVSRRRGKRTLTDTTFYYGVQPYGDFHDATADTIAAVDLIKPMTTLYPQAGGIELNNLVEWQREAHKKWAENFNSWLASKGRRPISTSWL
ncbi:MAG: DNA polymerase III subunit epsilon [Bifidobacteriaceae bacterium]|jgi:DNA polymerase-3 subunit epsilon|nr:DNA polymerase III subunit epsilon [Bifidobacteriaceae bacterium]